MHIDHIELVVVELERQLATALVAHNTAHPCGYGTLLLILELFSMMSLDETD